MEGKVHEFDVEGGEEGGVVVAEEGDEDITIRTVRVKTRQNVCSSDVTTIQHNHSTPPTQLSSNSNHP